jgi:hypothetical protein
MSCATSPECEIDRLLMWDDIPPIRALELCTGHAFERRVALERIEALNKEKPRKSFERHTLSRLQARMLLETMQAEAVGEENVIEFKRAKRRKKASGDDGSPDPSP